MPPWQLEQSLMDDEILRRPDVIATHCQVLLDQIEVMADIGALAAEHGNPQPLRIFVALDIVPPRRDHLDETFDYSIIRRYAEELSLERIVLIETFAKRLAAMCFASDIVVGAEVRIEKSRAVPGCVAGTIVRLGTFGEASACSRALDKR